ncbi:hypothetical protein B0T10DRAFT_471038 [Thelonectria olida]|uniref:Uncharacterized protein n=1 Tax=Thelonectria olida TaxID=1576542 RepID=A0A9P9AWK9_9HYPO|nr:hypothetical protein B0T10DRAFT_471038 [Thelonectria olida]
MSIRPSLLLLLLLLLATPFGRTNGRWRQRSSSVTRTESSRNNAVLFELLVCHGLYLSVIPVHWSLFTLTVKGFVFPQLLVRDEYASTQDGPLQVSKCSVDPGRNMTSCSVRSVPRQCQSKTITC